MKNDSLTALLVGVLALSAVVSVLFTYIYAVNSKELRDLQMQVMFINTRRAAIGALVNDTLEYGKTHAAIDPLLVSTGLKPAPATTKPAGK